MRKIYSVLPGIDGVCDYDSPYQGCEDDEWPPYAPMSDEDYAKWLEDIKKFELPF